MIGVYDYTVILTYLSGVSAGLGILASLGGGGHPYIGVFFLMVCGLCDAFDGKVARKKKNRSSYEKKFGIEIDSLCDILAFGVLPACIGTAMIRLCPFLKEILIGETENRRDFLNMLVLYACMLIYLIAGVIRLAHFNVTENMRQDTEEGVRKSYTGLPITSASLIFPTVLLLQYVTDQDITLLYFVVMLLTGFLFISKVKIPKPGLRGIIIMVGFGAIEFLLLLYELSTRQVP